MCGRRFSSGYRRRDHELLCGQSAADKPYSCSACGRKFTAKSNLRRHETTHVSAPSLCACSKCGRSFRRKHNMTTHVRRVHCSLRFACVTCCRQFRSVSALMRHLRSHKDGAPSHVCDQCGRSFSELCYLRMHQTVHARRTISCLHCERRFCRTAYLLKHRCKKLPSSA